MSFNSKEQDIKQVTNEEIDLLLETHQQAQQVEVPKQESIKQTKTKAIPNDVANDSTNAIVKVLTEFIHQQNENNIVNRQQEERLKQLELEGKYVNKAGLAIAEFAKKMDDEIKRGDYIEFPYYNQADKTGAIVTISINGYPLVFINGYSTAVPKSLKTEVHQYFQSFANSGNSLSRIMVSSNGQLNGPIDHNATNEVINFLNKQLPK